MASETATTSIRPDENPWWPLPLAEGAFVKGLTFDVETFRLVEEGDIGAALERVGAA